MKSLEVTSILNMMGVVGRVYQFFAAHPKHQRAFEKVITDRQPSSTSQKLKDMCRTQQIQRIDAVDIFKRLFLSIVDCFKNICNGPGLWSTYSLTDARGLQLAITTTEFVSALVITNSCLKYIQALTSSLQAEAKDIVAAMKEILLHQLYKMCVTTLKHIILSGFLPFLRCCHNGCRAMCPMKMW